MKLFDKPKSLHGLAAGKPESMLSAHDTKDVVYQRLLMPLVRVVDRLAVSVQLTAAEL